MQIVIVGNGAFGKAMHYVLSKNNDDIQFAKKGQPFEAEIVVLCAPANAISDILPLINFSKDTKIIINTSKGIETSSHRFPFQIVEDYFGNRVEYYSLMGPSFASEILKDAPTLVNIGYHPKNVYAKKVKNLFQTDSFRIRLTEGVAILEIASAMKNIYAIGCGISEGLGYGENTKVTLLTLAIDEMQQYFCSLTYRLCMDATPAMIGDLILTCTSSESRNFQFGKHLVNHSAKEALTIVQTTVEGYATIFSLRHFQKQSHIALPLADFIADIIQHPEKDIRTAFETFLKKI